MEEVKTGKQPLTWEQYTAAGMAGYGEVYKRMHS